LVTGFNQIVNFVGTIQRQVEAQFRVNPNLQRTQVKGTLRGVTKTTTSATPLFINQLSLLPPPF